MHVLRRHVVVSSCRLCVRGEGSAAAAVQCSCCGGRKLLGDPDDGDNEAVVLVVLGVMMMVRERVKRQAAMPGKNLNEADQ